MSLTSTLRTAGIYTSRTRITQTRTVIRQQLRAMSEGNLKIESVQDIKTATGVELTEAQKTIVGSVLDLFAGKPSLPKLRLWKDDATFEDNITISPGREKYSAQWYGLKAAFSNIERLHHEVTSAGNPIELDLKTEYTVKGLGTKKTIESKVKIFTEAEKITKVQDKWSGQLPESSFVDIFRKLNAVTVPKFVTVPKNDEEDRKAGNQ